MTKPTKSKNGNQPLNSTPNSPTTRPVAKPGRKAQPLAEDPTQPSTGSPSEPKKKRPVLKEPEEPPTATEPVEYEDHEIAACWRLMNEKELGALSESIKENGQRLAITLFEGKI